MTKKAFPIGVTLAVAALLFVALLPVAAGSDVTYCHATPADTAAGGWRAITTDDSGALPSSSHAQQHNADIIPAIPGVYPGKNLTTLFNGVTGADILANGCVAPVDPEMCEKTKKGDMPTPNPQYGEWSAWTWNPSTNLFVRSREVTTFTKEPYYDKDSPTYLCVPAEFDVTTETERKGAFQVIWSSGESTCDSMLLSWGATLVPEADPSLFKVYVNGAEVGTSGNSEAYGKDSYTLTFYYDGVLQTTHGPYSWVEPEGCEQEPVVTYRTYTTDDCKGWVVFEQEQRDGQDYGTPVDLLSGSWADPYTLEQATPSGEDSDGDAFSFTIDEDRECLVPAEYRTTFLYGYGASPEDPADCSGWWGILRLFDGELMVDSDYKAGLWTDPYQIETANVEFTVSDGDYSYSQKQGFTEPEECQQLHETGPWYTESCEGYEYGYVLDGQHVKTGEGKWANSFKAEEVTVQVIVPETQETFSIYIGKEEECLECKWTAVYPMSIYQPANPPQSYWHGPFSFSACAVIHDADEVPSADRVTMVCSLCPDQIEGGFIFNALNKPYTGYLYRVECYGKGVTYVFADDWHEFEWDEDWVRKGYTDDGHRCEDNPRIAGCSAWIHEQAGIPYYDPPDSQ